MFVYYVTMEWPVRSEVFAVNDINALMKQDNLRFKIAGLKPLADEKRESLSFLNVRDIPFFNMGCGGLVSGALAALTSPLRTFGLVSKIIRSESRWGERLKSLALIPSAYSVYKDVHREQPDIVHLFWGHYPALAALLLLEDKNPPQITMFLGAYDLRLKLGLSKLLAQNPSVHVMTHAHMNVDDIASWAKCEKDKIHVVHRGINLDNPAPRPSKIPEPVRLIFAGRLMFEKGTQELLETAGILARKSIDFTLTIVGDGPGSERMKAETVREGLEQRILFKGWMTQQDLNEEFKKSDILVFPSHKECLPNVVKEAMASGCLPVVSPTTAIDELVETGVNGWVTKSLVSSEFADAVEQALLIGRDEGAYQKMRDAARQKIERDFSCSRNMESYRALWQTLLERTHVPKL